MQVKKQQLEPDMEQQIGSKLEKEYDKALYCHHAYLIYIKSHQLDGNKFEQARGAGDVQLSLACCSTWCRSQARLSNWTELNIMWNAGLDESQAGIKIVGRNIENLRYIDDTTLMAKN